MISTIIHRVGSEDALGFWRQRLEYEGVRTTLENGRLTFSDPEGMAHELGVFDVPDRPLTAASLEVPPEFALQGFEAVRALVADTDRSEAFVRDALGFLEKAGHEWEGRGQYRGSRILFEPAAERGVYGAGTVHHVAWSVMREEQDQWREGVARAGAHPTPIIDRFYFESVYFREPGGILYELATFDGAGFTSDEPLESLGEKLALPPRLEPLRERVEPILTPLPDIRQWRPAPAART
jgi:glyoxalase family protein